MKDELSDDIFDFDDDDLDAELKDILFGDDDVPAIPNPKPYLMILPVGGEKERLAQEMKENGGWDFSLNRQCKYCGKEFRPRDRRHVFCSKNCWANYRHRHREVHSDSDVRTCKWCGKKMIGGDKRYIGRKSFCSMECRGKYNNAMMVRNGTRNGFDKDPERARRCGLKNLEAMWAGRDRKNAQKRKEKQESGNVQKASGAVQ